jgi:hypothetical protein
VRFKRGSRTRADLARGIGRAGRKRCLDMLRGLGGNQRGEECWQQLVVGGVAGAADGVGEGATAGGSNNNNGNSSSNGKNNNKWGRRTKRVSKGRIGERGLVGGR